MKKFVSIKGVIDNLRQSVNTPSPAGSGGATATGKHCTTVPNKGTLPKNIC